MRGGKTGLKSRAKNKKKIREVEAEGGRGTDSRHYLWAGSKIA